MNGAPQGTGSDPTGHEPRLWILGDVPLSVYIVRVEFDHAVSEDFAEDLAGNSGHRLLEFLPQVSVTPSGRIELRLTVPGPDLWTSVLTAMSVVTQAGYQPAAVQVTADDRAGDEPSTPRSPASGSRTTLRR
ncbi:MAG TPA: hypothetical protein VLJ88_05705 [Propionibacteriaceae bacterium]|nr:hypothetical protein [Propionibacteriaceae bacterium]